MPLIFLLSYVLMTTTASSEAFEYDYEGCSDPLESRVERIVQRRLEFLRQFPPETEPGRFPTRAQIREIALRDRDFAQLAKARAKFDASLAREQGKLDGYTRLAEDLARAAEKIDPSVREVPYWRWWKQAPLLVRVARYKVAYLVALPPLLIGRGPIKRRTDAVLRSIADDFANAAKLQKMIVVKTELEGKTQLPPPDEIVDRIRHELVFRRE